MWIVGIVVIVGWIGSVCIHEFGHAILAYWGGDTSVKDKGYLTLNPAKYMDPQMSLVLPVFFLLLGGIPLPGAAVYINDAAIYNRRWRSAVSAAGPIGTALSVVILSIPFWIWRQEQWTLWIEQESLLGGIWAALAFLIFLNIYMVFINSLPIPPLDGFGVIRPWLSPSLQVKARKMSQYGILVVFGLLWFVQPFSQLLAGLAMGIAQTLGVHPSAIAAGHASFRTSSTPIVVLAIVGAIAYQKWLKPKHKRYWEQGKQQLKQGNYEAALTQFDQAIELVPDFYEGHLSKALTLEVLERNNEAIAIYNQAIQLQPNQPQPYKRQAALFIQQNIRSEASICYHRLAELEPDNFYHQAAAAFFAEQYNEALNIYECILGTEPEDPTVWCNKACCYSHLKDLDNVVYHLKRAIELNPATKETIKLDPDLAQFRNHPRVQALLVGE